MICVEINQCVGATTRRACWLGRVVRPHRRHRVDFCAVNDALRHDLPRRAVDPDEVEDAREGAVLKPEDSHHRVGRALVRGREEGARGRHRGVAQHFRARQAPEPLVAADQDGVLFYDTDARRVAFGLPPTY